MQFTHPVAAGTASTDTAPIVGPGGAAKSSSHAAKPAPSAVPSADPMPTIKGYVPQPDRCGLWSADGARTGLLLTAAYGELRNCLRLYDGDWLITTTRSAARPGVVAVYHCHHVARCEDGRTDHPFAGWVAIPLPAGAAGASMEGPPPTRSDPRLLLSVGSGEGVFDIPSESFVRLQVQRSNASRPSR